MYKRTYHPLVILCFWQGILQEEFLKQVPASTRTYWNKARQKELYGYEWIEEFLTKNLQVKEVFESKRLYKGVSMLCRIYRCFNSLISQLPQYSKIVKNNLHLIIATIDRISLVLPLKFACRVFNFTTQKYYRFKNKLACTASVLNLCYKTHSQQLSLKEVVVIKEELAKEKNADYPLATIYYSMINKGKTFCSLGTFYKYAALLSQHRKKRAETKKYSPLRALKPFEYLHVDITNVPTELGTRKVAFIKENFSKAILHFGVSAKGTSLFIKDLFAEAFEKFNLSNHCQFLTIVSDGGPENKGELIEWIEVLENPIVKKITAKLDIPQSNSMAESANYIFKQDYLRGHIPNNDDELTNILHHFLEDFNHSRYPISLYGYTPIEVLQGAVPDRTRFKEFIEQARKNRPLENRGGFCQRCLV